MTWVLYQTIRTFTLCRIVYISVKFVASEGKSSSLITLPDLLISWILFILVLGFDYYALEKVLKWIPFYFYGKSAFVITFISYPQLKLGRVAFDVLSPLALKIETALSKLKINSPLDLLEIIAISILHLIFPSLNEVLSDVKSKQEMEFKTEESQVIMEETSQRLTVISEYLDELIEDNSSIFEEVATSSEENTHSTKNPLQIVDSNSSESSSMFSESNLCPDVHVVHHDYHQPIVLNKNNSFIVATRRSSSLFCSSPDSQKISQCDTNSLESPSIFSKKSLRKSLDILNKQLRKEAAEEVSKTQRPRSSSRNRTPIRHPSRSRSTSRSNSRNRSTVSSVSDTQTKQTPSSHSTSDVGVMNFLSAQIGVTTRSKHKERELNSSTSAEFLKENINESQKLGDQIDDILRGVMKPKKDKERSDFSLRYRVSLSRNSSTK